MTEDQIKYMVDRFLAWRLPENFNPDNGITFRPIGGANGPHPFRREPVGTNLLSATQATEMVRHMVDGLPTPESQKADAYLAKQAEYIKAFRGKYARDIEAKPAHFSPGQAGDSALSGMGVRRG